MVILNLSDAEKKTIDKDHEAIKAAIESAMSKNGKAKMVRTAAIRSFTGKHHIVTMVFHGTRINISFNNMETMMEAHENDVEGTAMSALAIIFAMIYQAKEITNAVIDYEIKAYIKAVAR